MKNAPINRTVMEGLLKAQAKYLAMVVRNAMEDFHSKNLTDEQMKELNPIIRNAIYTGVYAIEFYKESERAKKYLEYHSSMIPSYWEEPELLAQLNP
jgi:hypothetical protein